MLGPNTWGDIASTSQVKSLVNQSNFSVKPETKTSLQTLANWGPTVIQMETGTGNHLKTRYGNSARGKTILMHIWLITQRRRGNTENTVMKTGFTNHLAAQSSSVLFQVVGSLWCASMLHRARHLQWEHQIYKSPINIKDQQHKLQGTKHFRLRQTEKLTRKLVVFLKIQT